MKYWDIIWVTKLRYPPATDVWPFAIFDTFHSNWNVSNERMFSTNGSSNESNLPAVKSSNKQDVLNIHFSFTNVLVLRNSLEGYVCDMMMVVVVTRVRSAMVISHYGVIIRKLSPVLLMLLWSHLTEKCKLLVKTNYLPTITFTPLFLKLKRQREIN